LAYLFPALGGACGTATLTTRITDTARRETTGAREILTAAASRGEMREIAGSDENIGKRRGQGNREGQIRHDVGRKNKLFFYDQFNGLFRQAGEQGFMATVVVGESHDASAHAQDGLEAMLGHVDAGNDEFRQGPLLPSLPIRLGFQQRFGRPRNAHDGAPSALPRADRPQGETSGAAAPETANAVNLWTTGGAGSRLCAARNPVGAIKETLIKSKFVIPAKAGIHENQ
jgi:hypothetical protein